MVGAGEDGGDSDGGAGIEPVTTVFWTDQLGEMQYGYGPRVGSNTSILLAETWVRPVPIERRVHGKVGSIAFHCRDWAAV